jgi:UDPglucose 6-dehydrogenase/GDP-mannose 6-dehydrogenase
MIKYASNSLLAALISFSNEIGNLCASLGGVDASDVFRGLHLSQYLSPELAGGSRVTAPITAFLAAGCGFGGSCLPKDVAALVAHGQSRGEAMPLLSAVMDTNRAQPRRMIELLRPHVASLAGARVAVLGLAFKPDTDDVRESPALPLIRLLLSEGAWVRAYDPIANENAKRALGEPEVVFCSELDEALAGADAALLATAWDEFRTLPDKLRGMRNPPLLVDGRRLVAPHDVERYEGIGLGRPL